MATVTIRGKTYTVLFDLKNVQEMQSHYESLEGIVDALKSASITEVAYILHLLIREGVELDNQEHRKNEVAPSADAIEKMLTWQDLNGGEIAKAIEASFFEFYGKNGQSLDAMEQSKQMIQKVFG